MASNNHQKIQHADLPKIKDQDGEEFTSILDDIPATDVTTMDTNESTASLDSQKKRQIVLFISAKDEEGIEGNLIKQTLLNNDMALGDKDIYHYYVEKNEQTSSLFRIANGVTPWTLTDNDLINAKILGFSMVMLLPAIIKNDEAVKLFMEKADTIAKQVDGVLKNQQQELLNDDDRLTILNS